MNRKIHPSRHNNEILDNESENIDDHHIGNDRSEPLSSSKYQVEENMFFQNSMEN